MRSSFQATVSAIGYSVIRERCGAIGSGAGEDFPNNRVVRFLLEQHGRMAGHLRLAFWLVTLVFDGSSLPRHGRRFHTLPHRRRWRQIEAWRGSPLKIQRTFIRFFESLVIFYWYAEIEPATVSGMARHDAGPTRSAA